jgi:hypothetical protein
VLSGLVLPGLGQLVSGQPIRGLVFIGVTLAGLVVLVRRVARETLARLPEDPTTLDPLFPLQLAHEIQRDNAGFLLGITVLLVGVWAASVADAWRTSRPDRKP